MNLKKKQSGFADPISLIGIGVLVLTLITTTYLTTNTDVKHFFQSAAKSCEDLGSPAARKACRIATTGKSEASEESRTKTIPTDEVETAAGNTKESCTGAWCSGCGGFCIKGATQTCSQAEKIKCGGSKEVKTTAVCDDSTEGQVGMYSGIGDYKKCTNGRWEPCPTCKLTDVTIVPEYAKEQYEKEKEALTHTGGKTQQRVDKPENISLNESIGNTGNPFVTQTSQPTSTTTAKSNETSSTSSLDYVTGNTVNTNPFVNESSRNLIDKLLPEPTPYVRPDIRENEQPRCTIQCKTGEICMPTVTGGYCTRYIPPDSRQSNQIYTLPRRCNGTNTAVEEFTGGVWEVTQPCIGYCDNNTKSCDTNAPSYAPKNVIPPSLASLPEETKKDLSLDVQDPIFVAKLNNKYDQCSEVSGSEKCSEGLKQAAGVKDSCVAYYKMDNPEADTNQLQNRCDIERQNATLIAVTTPSLVSKTLNLASGGARTVSEIIKLAGEGGSVTPVSLGQAAVSYASASVSTLPTYAQTAISFGTGAVTIGTTTAGAVECVNSGDPNSPACVGMVTGYYSNVVDSTIDIADSFGALKLPLAKSSQIDNLLDLDTPNPNLQQIIRNEIDSGNINGGITVKLANQEIDRLIDQGVDELDAITRVGSSIVPDYAVSNEQKALLNLADKAKTADEVMQCQFTWCRHNSVISDEILKSRGYDPYRTNIQWQTLEGNPAGGHATSALIKDNEYVFVDFTNNKTIYGIEDLADIARKNNLQVTKVELFKQNLDSVSSPWEVVEVDLDNISLKNTSSIVDIDINTAKKINNTSDNEIDIWQKYVVNPIQNIQKNRNRVKVLDQIEQDIANNYEAISARITVNSPYKPKSSAIEPTTNLDEEILKEIKGISSTKQLPSFTQALNDQAYAKTSLADQIKDVQSLDDLRSLLKSMDIELVIGDPKDYGENFVAWSPSNKLVVLSSEYQDAAWPVLKPTFVHEFTHIDIRLKGEEVLNTKGTGSYLNDIPIRNAINNIGQEDWAYINQARTALDELTSNPNLTNEERTLLKQSIADAMKYYNYVVYGDVLPKKVGVVDTILNKLTDFFK